MSSDTGIMWDKNARGGGRRKSAPRVRVSYQPAGQFFRVSLTPGAVKLLCGRRKGCYIIFGLSKDCKTLYMKIAGALDKGARHISKKKAACLSATWLATRLGVVEDVFFAGPVVAKKKGMLYKAKLSRQERE